MHTSVFKNDHSAPPGSILLGVLKSIESELRRRDLLGIPGHNTTPLWFLAETERNVYLWRNGKSIDDHRQYTFWIDVKALLLKRRQQLQRSKGFNPFIASGCASAPHDGDAVRNEHAYLDCIEDLAGSIFKHAEALSKASESVRAELAPDTAERVSVVLPVGSATR